MLGLTFRDVKHSYNDFGLIMKSDATETSLLPLCLPGKENLQLMVRMEHGISGEVHMRERQI